MMFHSLFQDKAAEINNAVCRKGVERQCRQKRKLQRRRPRRRPPKRSSFYIVSPRWGTPGALCPRRILCDSIPALGGKWKYMRPNHPLLTGGGEEQNGCDKESPGKEGEEDPQKEIIIKIEFYPLQSNEYLPRRRSSWFCFSWLHVCDQDCCSGLLKYA